MTQREFTHILEILPSLSPEQLATLRRELDDRSAAVPPALSDDERADQELQRRLLAAGVVSEIKPPLRDLAAYRNRRPIAIQGEPLSETIIRERR